MEAAKAAVEPASKAAGALKPAVAPECKGVAAVPVCKAAVVLA